MRAATATGSLLNAPPIVAPATPEATPAAPAMTPSLTEPPRARVALKPKAP
jgi:hypothetical protein